MRACLIRSAVMLQDTNEPDDESTAMTQVESSVLRLCAAAQRRVPIGRLALQARDLGRDAMLLQIPEGSMELMLRHSLDALGCLDERTVATVVAAALDARRGPIT